MSINKKRFMIGCISVVLLSAAALAVTTELLPESSHYQGTSYFTTASDNGYIGGKVDFAVYDSMGGNEFAGAGYAAPGAGRYTYAYQIFSDALSDDPMFYFGIFGIGANAITDNSYIGSVDDGTGGISPDSAYLKGNGPGDYDEAVWEFDNGFLVADEHSWMLLLSSDHDWTAGSYVVERVSDGETPIPNPEPISLGLLGLGSLIALHRRRKNA
jgi:hypothetical protein